MNTIKKCLTEWDKLVKQYDKDAKEIQKKIAAVLKKDWTPENPGAITEAQMKQILDKSERFSMRAETKLLRTNFALDSIMCSIEGEMSDLRQNPTKKIKEEPSEDESDETDSDSDPDADSDATLVSCDSSSDSE